MAYSKETERQNEALSDILAGRKTEKRVKRRSSKIFRLGISY